MSIRTEWRMDDTKAGPDPVDTLVGGRVRLLRKSRGVSQSALAEAIGVTFQQVQKYERAANRISISMLSRMAQALDTTVGDLVGERADDRRPFDDLVGLMTEPSVLELVRAFVLIPEGVQRRAIVDFVRTLAENDRAGS